MRGIKIHKMSVAKDYEYMLKAYSEAGGKPEILKNSSVAHIVIHKNKILGRNLVRGLQITPTETDKGVKIELMVEEGMRIDFPVHLCFGILPEEGRQEIEMNVKVEDDAHIKLLAHCVFPNAVKIIHSMNAEIKIGENAYYEYKEVHYHGLKGGIEVIPRAKISLGNRSRFITDFSLLKGRVGVFDMDYEAFAGDFSFVEMTAKIYGFGNDKIRLREAGRLVGKNSRSLIKSRIVVKDDAISEIISEITAGGENSWGHVDCVEIVQGNSKAKAIPIVDVLNESAKVTHEASIGRIDKKQVETLMARGLEEEKAIDMVVSGILR